MLCQDSGTFAEVVERARAAERLGEFDDALRWYEHALEITDRQTNVAAVTDLKRWIGTVRRHKGDLDGAAHYYRESLQLAQQYDLLPQLASISNCLAILAQLRGHMAEAEHLYGQAGELAMRSGNQRLAAMVDQNLGTLVNTQGRASAAIACYTSALGHFRALGDPVACAQSLNNLGMAYVDLGEWSEAESCFDQAFDLADSLHDTGLLGVVELNRAELYLERRDFGRARDCCDRAFEIYSRQESRGFLGETYKFYGVLYREMARPGLADAHFADAVELAIAAEDKLLEAEAQSEWALVDLVGGRNQEALQRLNRAHQLFDELRASADLLDIENRLDGLEGTYLKVVAQWAISIESKDRYTHGHCERVADYACMLAEAVGFAGRDLIWFRMGGFLHDVGKTAVPADVLNKPGKLDDEEWKLMQSHTTVGDEIVARLNFPWDVRPLVRHHHERWDGTGYPDRLKGEEIHLTARILCIADVFDALTTARSYRPALSLEEAIRIMDRDSGKAFDPTLYQLFRDLIAPGMAVAA